MLESESSGEDKCKARSRLSNSLDIHQTRSIFLLFQKRKKIIYNFQDPNYSMYLWINKIKLRRNVITYNILFPHMNDVIDFIIWSNIFKKIAFVPESANQKKWFSVSLKCLFKIQPWLSSRKKNHNLNGQQIR